MKLNITLNKVAYITAGALVAFSGCVATYGLTKFSPGAFYIVLVMGALFEIFKLIGLAQLNRKWAHLPRRSKYPMTLIMVVLVGLNIMGVSGQLSGSYMDRRLSGDLAANSHASQVNAEIATIKAELDDIDGQIALQDKAITEANQTRLKTRNNDRINNATKAANDAEAKRTKLVEKRTGPAARLQSKQIESGQVANERASAAGEFAAVQFIASLVGMNEDLVAKIMIAIISAIPDLSAVLLVMVCEHKPPRKTKAKRKSRAKAKTIKAANVNKPKPRLSLVKK